MPRPLAIIVVNYQSSRLLELNLVATAESVDPAVVVVVDNYSSPEERRRTRELAATHEWDVVEAAENMGFGGGMNLGVHRALERGAEDFLLLNPDATITADSAALLQATVESSRSAVAAPVILDGSGRIWFEGADLYLADGLTRGVARRALRPDAERWDWLSGACLLVPDEAWRRSGGFDEDYFLYWEDVDFSRRLVESGCELLVVRDAVAVHDEGGTQRAGDPERAKSPTYYYFNIRNRMLFAVKHLDDAGVRRWRAGVLRSAREILLRGGRRQFLRPLRPLRAAYRGVRDARRLTRSSERGRT